MSHSPWDLEALERRCLLSGTTLIFHGAQGLGQIFTDDPGGPAWVDGMGDAIADEIAAATGGNAGDVARFELDINGSTFGGMSTSWNFASGYSPGVSATSASAIDNALDGQTIIEVDWADVSNPLQSDNEDTVDVAARVADVLINQLGQLGHKLLAAPIHLLGHSRGGSLIGALAEDFAQRGIWVDQLSFFDPHPIGGDFGAGGSVAVADNVVFADNYWQTNSSSTDLDGAPVTGAHNVQLTHSIISQGANGTGHSNTHVWYHATIDTVGSISDGDHTFDPDALNWFASNAATPTSPRDASGFAFSRIAHDTAQPTAGHWDTAARFATTVSNPGAAWSNVLLDTDWSDDINADAGGTLLVGFDFAIPTGTADVLVGLDLDGNPYNGNELTTTFNTLDDISGSGTQSVSIPLTGAVAGQSYRLFATITSDANGKSRTDYAPRDVVVTETVDTTPPTVVDLLVSGSEWTDAAFLQAIDPGRGLGYSVPVGNGSQLATLAWGNIDQIHIVFSEDVTVTQDDLIVNGVNVAKHHVTGFAYNAATFTATWSLDQDVPVDKVLVDAQDTIKDAADNSLDGDWENPTGPSDVSSDSYASGDGTAGGDFEFRFNVVPGDTDGNGIVQSVDLDPLLAGLGLNVGDAGYTPLADIDGSGVITSADIDQLKSSQQQSLPATEPIPTDGVVPPLDTIPGDRSGKERDRPPAWWRSVRAHRVYWAWQRDDRRGGVDRPDDSDRRNPSERAIRVVLDAAWHELTDLRRRR